MSTRISVIGGAGFVGSAHTRMLLRPEGPGDAESMVMRKTLVTGAGGMLGRDVTAALRAAGHRVVPLPHGRLDITSSAAVRDALWAHAPDAVVNCAAFVDVDAAETNEATALRINGDGVRHLATACAETRTRLLHVSTDYVFAGDSGAPYAENAPADPRTAYGRTKLAGERAVLELLPHTGTVVRTAWLYGSGGSHFVATVARLAHAAESGGWPRPIGVVDDQRGQPTWTWDVSVRIAELLGRSPIPGVLHATNGGEATWYGLAREVVALLGLDPELVRPIGSEELGRPAVRPARSTLSHERWAREGFSPMRHWRAALHAAWPTLGL
ncbi:dTDP-4-dehydrorhamnose reductase [Streptomyces gardneri]|uniref:dTDP-4-dehydrorhamnose reductase n=1 Tax=Streptomyces gardneri TaxID=66892 RepID=UPI0035E3B136